MGIRTKAIFFPLFLTISTLLFSQQKTNTSLFEKEIKKRSTQFSDKPNFNKAQSFYLAKEWDSTLVYTMKQLNVTTNTEELKNYCHLFRGHSFFQKKTLKEAKRELLMVSKTFYFYNRVKMILGTIALEQSKFKDATHYFKEIEHLSTYELYGIKKSNIEHNLGICYLHLKEFDAAEPYLIKSLKLQEEQKDTLGLIGTYGNIASLYYEQYKDQQAIPYFEKAYRLSKTTTDYTAKQNTARNMAVVEENRKNLSQSLVYRKEYEKWRDSLNDQNKIWEVAELEKQFAVKQKQKEVQVLQAENKIKIAERNGFLYSAIVLLVVLAAGVYFYREKVKTNAIITKQKETLDELNATKDKLFSIVSHDLRSSVHALKTSNTKLVDNLENKNLEVLDGLLQNNSAIVNGAYNLLDNLLHWALLQTQQSYFEITSIRLFFIVEQIAYNYKPLMLEKNVDFKNKVSKSDMVYADQESLKIILRNLIDNAIKFSNPDGEIKIYSRNTDDIYCELIVEDSGVGMNENTRLDLLKDSVLLSKKENENTIGTGLGLQLCKSMIKKNKGKFSVKSELGKGTKMIVSLPKTPPNG
ncbi:tetratricopeptide repeat-containing sensor histidine kinase [Aquimarina algiphila]|uniref:histidine kinase n=1 Tax=Aquimarina algiphila TaxID=2047982 RepID=A0A554VP87_9FLAO|nr:tetratricopeptide repeat-containing sensor histidine kinase [Aquimarina algiphila]TSE10217.1 sensor histidine kinase [Aquimarina algiphila]